MPGRQAFWDCAICGISEELTSESFIDDIATRNTDIVYGSANGEIAIANPGFGSSTTKREFITFERIYRVGVGGAIKGIRIPVGANNADGNLTAMKIKFWRKNPTMRQCIIGGNQRRCSCKVLQH